MGAANLSFTPPKGQQALQQHAGKVKIQIMSDSASRDKFAPGAKWLPMEGTSEGAWLVGIPHACGKKVHELARELKMPSFRHPGLCRGQMDGV